MSDDDLFATQGRAYAAQKRLKTEVATLKTALMERNRELVAITRSVEEFLHAPDRRDPGAPMPSAGLLSQRMAQFDVASTGSVIEELFRKGIELRLIEEQIKEF